MISANRILNALSKATCIFKVEYAASGIEALKKIDNNPPSAVLVDMQLPDMGGTHILQQIKRKYPNIIVIVLTEFPSPYTFNACKKIGAAGYFDKINDIHTAIGLVQKLTS